ncbi:tRNA adenosine deaminase-associated protein [Corynebacterium freiburgense]|uniref:tRNA adenosine deaminase-associated protein n=1 Tax=Corynebacterium freiburgense TaxID=556548 RepID=UPI0004791B00|nr:tRNA adenosine deaminase-associated protein [Corynebacterium freiburgense]WJZ01412.1 hypothetical protein CFREI_00495 [Corynebacterium freiburgense]
MNETEPLVAPLQGYDADSSFAVAVCRTPTGAWFVTELPSRFTSIDETVKAIRDLREHGHVFSMSCVNDDYFIVARPVDSGARVLLSDSCMAVADAYADTALTLTGDCVPDLGDCDLADPCPAGDFGILEDFGLSAATMQAICGDYDLLPSAQLVCIATELGFDAEFAKATDLYLE